MLDEDELSPEFLQARIDELAALGQRQNPERLVMDLLQLVRDGQAGQDMNRWDAQIYSEALELLAGSLRYREDVGELLDALDTYLAQQ